MNVAQLSIPLAEDDKNGSNFFCKPLIELSMPPAIFLPVMVGNIECSFLKMKPCQFPMLFVPSKKLPPARKQFVSAF